MQKRPRLPLGQPPENEVGQPARLRQPKGLQLGEGLQGGRDLASQGGPLRHAHVAGPAPAIHVDLRFVRPACHHAHLASDCRRGARFQRAVMELFPWVSLPRAILRIGASRSSLYNTTFPVNAGPYDYRRREILGRSRAAASKMGTASQSHFGHLIRTIRNTSNSGNVHSGSRCTSS